MRKIVKIYTVLPEWNEGSKGRSDSGRASGTPSPFDRKEHSFIPNHFGSVFLAEDIGVRERERERVI
jgi:hypothetical protein